MMIQRKKNQVKDGRWTRDPVKEAYWRKQLELWQQSGLSIRAFCKEHGVVETSFYAWRRELIVRARERGDVEEITEAERVTPNILTDGRGRKLSIRYRQSAVEPSAKDTRDESRNPFVPITVKNEVASLTSGKENAGIEIALPGGAVVRVNENSNLRLVAQLLSLLKG